MTNNDPLRIVFVLYPRVTQLDVTGPYEVLVRLPGAKAVLASLAGGTLEADMGLSLAGLQRLSDIERCDMLVVPGGPGQTAAINDRAFMAEIERLARGASHLVAVCTGSLILGAAGLLRGRRAGCHWAYRDLLEACGAVADDRRVVRDGHIISGGGVTAGIDIALQLVADVAGEATARSIQLMIEYAPSPPFSAGRPETAPPELVAKVRRAVSGLVEERRQAIATALGRG